MTDADSFYDKLLASIGLPSDDPEPPSNYNHKEPSRDYRRNSNGRNVDERERETSRRPTEPQSPQKPKPQFQPPPPLSPPPKLKLEPLQQKLKPESNPVPAPEPQPKARSASNTVSSLPPKPILSPDLRDKLQSLTKQLSISSPPPLLPPPPPPPPPSVAPSKSPSAVPFSVPLLPERPQAKEEPRKTPATLEAELRRKLLENGLRKRKASPPEGRVVKADGADKRQKITPPPLPVPSSAPESVVTKEKYPATNAEAIKSRQAELRRKLLERSNLIKQKPSSIQTNGDVPKNNVNPPRKINRSYSPIEISSDDDDPPSTPKMVSTLPPFLPPRPPPREGFKLRVSVPFSMGPGRAIVLKTEKLPLSTPISSILELFGTARDGDHLYFPGSNPKPTAEIESGEKADLVLGEEGQRFYRNDDETGREAHKAQEAVMTSPKTVVKKEEGWHPRSATSSLVGGFSLRGDAMDHGSGGHLRETAEPHWTGLSATLEDIWTRGKQVVDCTLVRAGDGEDEGNQEFPERYPPLTTEDRGNGWHPQHQHRNSCGDFQPGNEHRWADEQGEEGEGEEEEVDGEGWGPYNEGYPEGDDPTSSMNWVSGYAMDPGPPPGPWNPEQYPMIPNTNIPDPWYAAQHTQFQHSGQPSPVFSQHDESQGPAFMGGAPVLQAMHWVPGHMDYANAGWTYGYVSNEPGQAGGVGPNIEPAEETTAAADPGNKVVLDGKQQPAQGQAQQPTRVQIGAIKQKRPRGGRQVKKKERRKGGGGSGGVGRSSGSGVGIVG